MGFQLFESSGTFNPSDWGLKAGDIISIICVRGGGIPAADSSAQLETELWVRTDRFADANQMKIYNGSIVAKDYIEI